jgi:hypothetical protein
MAQVLTDKDGNPLWIPAGTPGREEWAKVIYGISEAEALRLHYEEFGSYYFPIIASSDLKSRNQHIAGASKSYVPRREYLSKQGLPERPTFSPVFIPFWLVYRFQTEQDLDEYLSLYAHKLINFDWKDTLETICLEITAYLKWLDQYLGARINESQFQQLRQRLYKDAEISMQLLAAEYLYYLGPIKFTLKYSIVCPLYGYLAITPMGSGIQPHLSFVAWRDVLIFHTANGKQLKYIFDRQRSRNDPRKMRTEDLAKMLCSHSGEGSGSAGPFERILFILPLSEIVSIEARDEEVTGSTPGYTDLRKLLEDIPLGPLDLTTVHILGFTRLTTSMAPTIAPTPSATTILYSTPTTAELQPASAVPPPTTTTTPTTTTAESQPAPKLSSATTALPSSPTIAPTSAQQSKLMGSLGGLAGLALAGIVLLLLLRRE